MTHAAIRLRCAALLNVSPSASELDIKRAFREKAKTLHPDTAGVRHEDGRDFGELREAYEFLLKHGSTEDVAVDNVYGPGMQARFEAAKMWRERQGSQHSHQSGEDLKLKDHDFKTSRCFNNDPACGPDLQPSSIRTSYTAQRMRQRYKPSCSGTRRGSRLLGRKFPLNSLSRVSQTTTKVFAVSTIFFMVSSPFFNAVGGDVKLDRFSFVRGKWHEAGLVRCYVVARER